jgi:hypothetical protein
MYKCNAFLFLGETVVVGGLVIVIIINFSFKLIIIIFLFINQKDLEF